jgi:hypothetical protein
MVSKPQDTGVATFQTDVGPGDVTGVYYITICNVSLRLSTRLPRAKPSLTLIC